MKDCLDETAHDCETGRKLWGIWAECWLQTYQERHGSPAEDYEHWDEDQRPFAAFFAAAGGQSNVPEYNRLREIADVAFLAGVENELNWVMDQPEIAQRNWIYWDITGLA